MVIKEIAGSIRRILILCSKVSGVPAAASVMERIIFPRLPDLAVDVLELCLAELGAWSSQSRTSKMTLGLTTGSQRTQNVRGTYERTWWLGLFGCRNLSHASQAYCPLGTHIDDHTVVNVSWQSLPFFFLVVTSV